MKKTKAYEQTDFNSTVAHQRDSQEHLRRLTASPDRFHSEARTAGAIWKKTNNHLGSSFDECGPVLGLPRIESFRAVRGADLQLPFIFDKVRRFWWQQRHNHLREQVGNPVCTCASGRS